MPSWMNTVCHDHVTIGLRDGIVQADHGSPRRLSRLSRGDRMATYSPRTTMRGGNPVQWLTAIGTVVDDRCYQVRLRPDFSPWRRDVAWTPCVRRAPVHDLLDHLSFTRDRTNWGVVFRRGLFEITALDWLLIASAMGAGDLSGDAR